MHHVSLSCTTQVRSLMGLRRVVCGALVLLCGHDPSQQALKSHGVSRPSPAQPSQLGLGEGGFGI